MILTLVAFVGLTFAVLVMLALPLLRRQTGPVIRAAFDMQVYRDQLRELEKDLERGVVTPEQADAARLEIHRRLLAADTEARAVGAGGTDGPAPGRRVRILSTVMLAVLLPVLAFGLYGRLGSPGYPDRPHTERMAEMLGLTPEQAKALRTTAETMVKALNSGSGQQADWIALGQTWQQLGEYTKALNAYEKAAEKGPLDAASWASMGEANVMASNGQVMPGAKEAFLKALAQDRNDPRSRYYLGMAAVQAGDAPRGIAIWRDLSQDSPPDAPWMRMLRSRIAQAAQEAGIPPMGISPRHPLDLRPVETVAIPPAAQPESQTQAEEGFTPDQRAMVDGMIQRLKDRLDANPQDPEGWARLGKSLGVLKDYDGSVNAYAKAVEQDSRNIGTRLDYGMALLARAENAKAPSLPDTFYEQAQWMENNAPDEPGGLYLRALAAESRKQTESAIALWTKLSAAMPPDSPAAMMAQDRLKALGSR